MKLEELDFFEFFKDEYGTWYNGFGIGGSGIITPNQMINVVNIDGAPKDGVLSGWGGGEHLLTWAEIIKQIYKIDYDNTKPYETGDIRKGIELRLIEIRYVNMVGNKFIVIRVPAKINKFQYDSLGKLNTMIQAVNTLSKNEIQVGVINTGYIPNIIHGMTNSSHSIAFSDLSDALEYYNKHITIIPPNVFPKEYKIELNKAMKR